MSKPIRNGIMARTYSTGPIAVPRVNCLSFRRLTVYGDKTRARKEPGIGRRRRELGMREPKPRGNFGSVSRTLRLCSSFPHLLQVRQLEMHRAQWKRSGSRWIPGSTEADSTKNGATCSQPPILRAGIVTAESCDVAAGVG